MKKRKMACLALASTCVSVSVAQESDNQESDNAVKLAPVTITASPLGQSALDLAQPTNVLYGDDLRNKTAATIGETLSGELGVSASDFGLGASRPIIRGQDAPRVRVLQNGIGSLDVSNISPDHAVAIEPLGVRQIEILRGPSSLLYGSGAIGGVVNIVTNRIPDYVPENIEAEVDLRYNTVSDERTAAFNLTGGAGPIALHLEGSSRETNDYEIPDDAADDADTLADGNTLVNSAVDTDNVALGGSLVGERGFAGLSVGRFLSEYGIPGEAAFIDADQTRWDFKAELFDPLPGFSRLKADFGYNDYEHTEFEGPGEPGTVFENDEFEGRVELTHKPIADWNGALGVQYRNRDFEAIGEEAFVPQTDLRSVGVFLVEERRFGPLTLQLGARAEFQETDASAGNRDREHELYSFSGGVVYDLAGGYTLGLSASRSQRAPDIQELYSDGPHLATRTFELGDNDLGDETAHSIDLTLRKTEGRLGWQVNLFANFFDDFIFQESIDSNGDGIADRVNEEGELEDELENDGELLSVAYTQDDADFYGFETEVTYRLLEGGNGDLDGRLFADFVRAKLSDGGNLPRITPPRFGGGLEYQRGQLSAGVDVTRVSRQDFNAELETETSGYTMVDTDLAWTIPSGGNEYQLFLRGTNLLDEEIRRHTSFIKDFAPQPGRSVLLGFKGVF